MARPKSASAAICDIPERLNDEELNMAIAGCTDAGIIRGLIEAEIRFIRAGGERDIRTLRGFWYQVIKSALSRTGLLNKKTSKNHGKDWAAVLSEELEGMVSDHITTYEELKIIDGSRQRSVATPINHTVAKTQWVGAHYPWVIIFTEKDTIWPVLSSIAQLYGVSFISCGGQPAASCTEDIIKQIVRSDAFKQRNPEKINLVGITDYDPSGYNIFNAQKNQIIRFFPANELNTETIIIEATRLGVYPFQIPPDDLDIKSFSPPAGKELDEWVKETGGINGLPLGIELDSLPISEIRKKLAEAIEECISLDHRQADLRQAFMEELAWETLMPVIEARKKQLIEAVKATPIWAEIQDTPIPSEIFKKAAIEGKNVVNPMSVFDCADDIRAIMSAVNIKE